MSSLREGFTTGTCAAAAAKAAIYLLHDSTVVSTVEVTLPDTTIVQLPIAFCTQGSDYAQAGVYKNAGDDPDVTDQMLIIVTLRWLSQGDVQFLAGEGVGIVSLPGLSLAPGEPAINPIPRSMIRTAIREVTTSPVEVTVSIPGGCQIAEKTFNPRLGIVGGLSILGTTGRVRPFSVAGLRQSLDCALNVALANGIDRPIFVPGNIGRNAAWRLFQKKPPQVIEVSNEWGYMLQCAAHHTFTALLVLGHPGKIAKLGMKQWDTHSSKSTSVLQYLMSFSSPFTDQVFTTQTAEGFFASLDPVIREQVATKVAHAVSLEVCEVLCHRFAVAVVLVTLQGEVLGSFGDLLPWR